MRVTCCSREAVPPTPATVGLALLAASRVLVASTPTTQAIPVTPFLIAFQTNDNGNIFTIGNNLLACPASASTCAGARNGSITGANASNNAYAMVNLDVDTDPTTFNSSNSQLILPPGSSVLWAGPTI